MTRTSETPARSSCGFHANFFLRRCLPLVVAFGLSTGLLAQELPGLEEVVVVASVEYREDSLGNVVSNVTGRELAPQDTLLADLLSDVDADGVPGIRDACPLNPSCQTFDDIANGESDLFTPHVTRFESMEDVVQWGLEENQAKELYDMEALIDATEDAGFDAEIVQGWRDEFLEPDPPDPETCKECKKRVRKACKEECRGKRGREKYLCRCRCYRRDIAECREGCSAEAGKIKKKIRKVKKKILKTLRKPRRQRPPGLLNQLFAKLQRLVRRLFNLIWGW